LSATNDGKATARAEPWLGVVEQGTEFVATAQLEAGARRTGLVRRTAQSPGKVLLAVVTGGTGSVAQTSCAQLAATGAPGPRPGDVSPAARQQRMRQRGVGV